MATSTEQGWEDGTAVAGAAYSEAIAKSEPDFEHESGTAVAGPNYVENVRKSAVLVEPAKAAVAAGTPAPSPVVRPSQPRAPTMAFGTPALLRAPAPAPAPERRTPAPLPGMAAPERRTPAPVPGMRQPGPIAAIPNIPARAPQSRKPAPSGFVDQPFGHDERPNMDTAAATPIAKERVSGGIAASIANERPSGRVAKPFVAEERRSARISASMPQERDDGRYSSLPARAPTDIDTPFVDDGAEDESAGDLDEFDHAETMGQPQQRQSSPVIERPAPAPLRPTPLPMRAVSQGYEPAGEPAYAMPEGAPGPTLPQQHPQYAPMPTEYRRVSADEMDAFRSPEMSAMIHDPAPAPGAVAPKRRVLLIAVSLAVLVGLAVGAYFVLVPGDEGPMPTASEFPTKPKKAKPPTADEPAPADTPAAAAKPPASEIPVPPVTTVPGTTTTAKTAPTTTPATTTTAVPATTAKTAPTTTKAVAKTTAKPTATKKKVAKKPVRKAPIKRKAPVKRATVQCSGLDCL